MRTIKSSVEIDELFRKSKRLNGSSLRIMVKRYENQRDLDGRVGFIAGKRLGNAVYRNRSRRVLREAARTIGLPIDGYDILLVATGRTGSASSNHIANELRALLMRAGISNENQ